MVSVQQCSSVLETSKISSTYRSWTSFWETNLEMHYLWENSRTFTIPLRTLVHVYCFPWNVNANQNWLSGCTGTEKNALLISMTEKNLPSVFISFNNVEGSGTIGTQWITAEFTACRSCTILQLVEGGDFFIGNNKEFLLVSHYILQLLPAV